MADYWGKRHAEALAKADSAATPELRDIYRVLAAHYLSLQQAAKDGSRTPD
ncbi:MAG: hypothetical protein ABIO85_05730 [Sphingomicrobium sp.]